MICTDSSSLLSPAAAAALGVDVVPIPVAVDGEPFAEDVDVFYARLRAGAVATTSQPSPAVFLETYARAAGRGADGVLSLHLDRRVSGAAASAELAASEATIPVSVVDVPTVSFGVALCVRAARTALDAGADAADVAAETAGALDNVFVARAAARGRVTGGPGEWTLLRFADATAQRLSIHATIEEAADAMLLRVLAAGASTAAAVGHAARGVEAAADAFAHALLRVDSVRHVERYRVGPSVGAHTGHDSFGAFWWKT